MPQTNIEKVQQLKHDPEFNNAHAQVILQLIEQVLQVSPDEPFTALAAAFESGDYGYFKLSFRRDTGDSDEESALWMDYVHRRYDPEFKPQLERVISRLEA